MAKTKQRKNSRKKQEENEILFYIYGLVAITLCVIGILNIGFIGETLTSLIKVAFGNLYGIVYAVIAAGALYLMMKKDFSEISWRYVLGSVLLVIAWMLLAAVPKDEALKSIAVFEQYMEQLEAIYVGELSARGGIIGALAYAMTSLLFDRNGTYIVIAAMVLLSMVFLLKKEWFTKLWAAFVKVKEPLRQAASDHREKKEQKKEEKRIKEAQQQEEMEESTVRFEPISLFEEEKPKQSMMFGRIDADDAYEEEQVLFDATKQKNGTIQFIDVDEVVGASKPKQTIVQKESEPTVIEQITGKKDNFVSQYEIDYSKYRLPKLSLLKESGRKGRSSANITAANESGKRLMEILEEFGVKATLTATHIGPSVTKFEVKPDLGVRVNKISNLQHDIKMALAAKDIRIEAPIPGKSAVGIEIPNVEKTAVSMRELMKEVPAKYHDSKLMFALGKDLLGNGIYGELNKMPHLLIAGATGSGKSVCVNSIITSILLRSRPDEVKLLLIDPKKVEFTPYHNIPHLIAPVITDGEEASRALKVIVTMMDNRYELFSMAGVRNIAGYNAYLEKHPEEQLSKLPWIVVIIDELADLMLVAAKDVEASIQRITQLARAAGIHLIVATQRPSVDVITGIIKANIPSRIAFAVSSAVDSRTILDQSGAEKLLGYGDMLYIPVGEQVPLRVQGAFVSDEEVAAITQFVSAQGKPKFEDAFVRLEMLDGSVGMSGGDSGDPLYEEVKAFVIEARKASTSLIQRKFSIGYSRAARLIDVLEENGVIGPSRGSKPREVYAKAEKEYEDE